MKFLAKLFATPPVAKASIPVVNLFWHNNKLSHLPQKVLIEKHQVGVFSHYDICQLKHEFPVAVIRIGNPGQNFDPLKFHSSDILELSFTDLQSTLSDEETFSTYPFRQMKEAVQPLKDFIALHLNKTILVHCSMGQSRSAAVAEYIMRERGDLDGIKYMHDRPELWTPNYFLRLLLKNN